MMAFGATHHLADLHAAGLEETLLLLSAKSGRYRDTRYPSEEPFIPDHNLFHTLSLGATDTDRPPTIAECAVHLEMLEVFHALRTKVIQSSDLDTALDIHPQRRTVYERGPNMYRPTAIEKKVKDSMFEKRRAGKWTCFLQLAASRFHDWIRAVNVCIQEDLGGSSEATQWILPPLDILVVWHAFLLNPSDFKEYCDKKGLERVQGIGFPWGEIHKAINSFDWTYTLPPEAEQWLRANTGLEPDLFATLTNVATNDTSAWRTLKCHSTWGHLKHTPIPKPQTFSHRVQNAVSQLAENKPLVDNVQRQCVFVDKMHAHRWIRSPGVEGTLRRAIARYDKFIQLFRSLDRFLVPTLDVDLVWHTHQCSADHYRQFVVKHAGRFINHEDNISRGTLNNGFSSAEYYFREQYGDQYHVCLCWYCEAILSSMEELDNGEDADMTAVNVDDIVQKVERQVHYYKEVEVARRLGRPLPKDDDV